MKGRTLKQQDSSLYIFFRTYSYYLIFYLLLPLCVCGFGTMGSWRDSIALRGLGSIWVCFGCLGWGMVLRDLLAASGVS